MRFGLRLNIFFIGQRPPYRRPIMQNPPDGYLVKAAVPWLPFPPDWAVVPGAQAGLRLFAPLPYDHRLSLVDRARKVFVLVRVVQIALQE